LIINIAYLFLTDQKEMRKLKEKMKGYQKQIKDLQKKNPKKALEVQKQAMELNMKYMKHSFKPTLYTFIPIIIIFGWMNAHLAYDPLLPNEPFTVYVEMQPGLPGEVTLSAIPELDVQEPVRQAAERISWIAKGGSGDYTVVAKYGEVEVSKEVLVDERNYIGSPVNNYDGAVRKLGVEMNSVHPLPFRILGWNPGWLGTYILLSIVFSIGMRKVLRIS
jgi:uncharacterized membrane protein (DUF106 family)